MKFSVRTVSVESLINGHLLSKKSSPLQAIVSTLETGKEINQSLLKVCFIPCTMYTESISKIAYF